MVLLVLGNAIVCANEMGNPSDPFAAIFGGMTSATHGTSYAGKVFDPLTTRGRSGSVLPTIREARLHQSSGADDAPEITHETVITPTPNGGMEYEAGPILSDPNCEGELCDDCDLETCPGVCSPLGSEWDLCGMDDQCVPLCLPRFQHLAIFAGVHGFKGPRDGGLSSNFGFQEGVQIGGRAPLLPWPYLAYQLGYQAAQSRLHGDMASYSETARRQHLATAGLFHRRQVGLQWGVVYDLMQDDLVEDLDFWQVRGEISLVGPRGGEIGFWTAVHTNDEGSIFGDQRLSTFEAVDQYVLFYRWHFFDCGEARLWGGMTDYNDGLFGGDFLLPIDDRWSLQGGFNYLIPEEDDIPDGLIQESWNLSINLVWHFGCDGCTSHSSPYRPLMNVVDNGTMFLDRITP